MSQCPHPALFHRKSKLLCCFWKGSTHVQDQSCLCPELSLHLAVVWDEEALLEEQSGHQFYAHWVRTQAAVCWAKQE